MRATVLNSINPRSVRKKPVFKNPILETFFGRDGQGLVLATVKHEFTDRGLIQIATVSAALIIFNHIIASYYGK